jgi:inorganic phosphate transporter, PiT family
MTWLLILVAVACLAYANGANDNFKGVATLFGSGTANYQRALTWATLTTLAGSLAALFLAGTLLKSFTGKGLVDDALAATANYGAAVALGAGLTVLVATRLGMPVSTTHGLVGALVGAGWAAGSSINAAQLGGAFFLPLLASPLVALTATVLMYPLFGAVRRWLGISEQTCFCVGSETVEVKPAMDDSLALARVEALSLEVGSAVTCQRKYKGRMLGLDAAHALDRMHYLSAGVVSFARGLNDTPKIAALLLLAPAFGRPGSTAFVAALIALGGVFSARRVAETMSQKITPMNHGQGFTANLITGVVVILASRFGLPVSTTHVSCGSLFGIGAVTRKARFGMIGKIVAAWVTTLPLGTAFGALSWWLMSLA